MNFRLVIFFLVMTFGVHAQKSPKLDLYDFSDFDEIIALDSLKANSATLPDIKADHWEHTVYNPYKKVNVQFHPYH